MARRNRIEAKRHALLQQRSELNLLVAAQAGIGGLTAGVGIHEVRDDLFFEFFRKVPDIKWNSQLIADTTGVGRILQRTATAGLFPGLLRVFVQREVNANHLVAGFYCTGGGNR